MRDGLTIFADWAAAEGDVTSARIKIDIAGNNASRAENHWSQSIDDAPILSAMPLALWLASFWWRLRWEGKPVVGHCSTSWRMAHEVAAAGYGFLWPRLTFVSDGEIIRAECLPTEPRSREMIRYISNFDISISAEAFEAGVDNFLSLVLERTAGSAPHLRDLWSDVLAERADPEATNMRRLEAALGFDPEEVPDALMQRLVHLQKIAGQEAAMEIAALCSGANPSAEIEKVTTFAEDVPGVSAHLVRSLRFEQPNKTMSAPDRGRTLAHSLRAAAGISQDGPVSDDKLGDLLGLREAQFSDEANAPRPRHPLAMMVSDESGRDRIIFRGRYSTGKRFEAARLLCDGLMQKGESWHPATASDTARQKMQRAFAAEFLVPIESLAEYLGRDYSMDAIEGAADYFSVSSYTVGSHLANNGLIRRTHPAVPA
ncbi:ImmA/IrrE family metallo-endopeptidase [Paracraurococcus lichenis]|uniref:ImmA/IrrE family metallo-endopeptidase n=1 Tax=Paracraurococcus lichenis TaxID=3064888 RepID=A0ABT9E8R8_9PROT|nr:hypothetical protein [Paracraurococcus sp. LOR1-02]MDO9712373.1 hypothetical protein [Paracraurococcus sp. LOR1-02]